MSKVLVVGGGGYIGSHTCLDLARKGHTPVVFDNFSNGHREFVKWGPLEEGDIRDTSRLEEVFARHQPEAIVHFAGLIEVGQSMNEPLSFFDNNVAGSISLFRVADRHDCRKVVFSSTCATYGLPLETPISEKHPQSPINPYGGSKLIVETILNDLCAHGGFEAVMLRYFNAAGAAHDEGIGERHDPETHALPLAIDAALGRRAGFQVFGRDYETRDGTCVRDFVHVMDLADAHTKAVEYLLRGGASTAINLGTGTGTTVRELLATVREVSGRDFRVDDVPRRPGNSPALIADNRRARQLLGWEPTHDLESIVSTAWQWHAGAAASAPPYVQESRRPVHSHGQTFDLRTRSRDRDRQTDERRLARLSALLDELASEIENERAGLSKRLHEQSADAGFLSDALDNGEQLARSAGRLEQLTAALTYGHVRIAELARQAGLIGTLRRTLHAAQDDRPSDTSVAK